MQGQAVFVGGFALDIAAIPGQVMDRIANNDAIVAYMRLMQPQIQQRINNEHLTLEQIADLCFQGKHTLYQSLARLELLGLITVSDVKVPRRTQPAKQIAITPMQVQMPPMVDFSLPGTEPDPEPEPTPGKKGKVRHYRPEWGKNAPQAVFELLDALQGGPPANITQAHYRRHAGSAADIAEAYTPDEVRARFKTISWKPSGWLHTTWLWNNMPQTPKEQPSHDKRTEPHTPTQQSLPGATDRNDLAAAFKARKAAKATGSA